MLKIGQGRENPNIIVIPQAAMNIAERMEKLLLEGYSGEDIVRFRTAQVDRQIRNLIPLNAGTGPFAVIAIGGATPASNHPACPAT